MDIEKEQLGKRLLVFGINKFSPGALELFLSEIEGKVSYVDIVLIAYYRTYEIDLSDGKYTAKIFKQYPLRPLVKALRESRYDSVILLQNNASINLLSALIKTRRRYHIHKGNLREYTSYSIGIISSQLFPSLRRLFMNRRQKDVERWRYTEIDTDTIADDLEITNAKRYVNNLRGILNDSSEELLSELHNVGTVYRGRYPKEKVHYDLIDHGIRYYLMSRLATYLCGKSGKILEVGCNSGLLSIILKDLQPDKDVVAIDLSPKQIEMANILSYIFKVNLTFKIGNGTKLSDIFPSDQFDVIYLCEILEHLEEQSGLQEEMLTQSVNICKPKGAIVVTVPYEDRIPLDGHKTIFDRAKLESLIKPYAGKISWYEKERKEYMLEKHFILSFVPVK